MRKTETHSQSKGQMIVSLVLGGMLALGMEILMLLLGAVAVSNGILQEEGAARITVVSCVLGCLIGGWFCCGRWPSRRLFAGLGTGAVCFLLILVMGMLMGEGQKLGTQGMVELGACLCGGGGAGLLCSKRKKGKGRARRHGK